MRKKKWNMYEGSKLSVRSKKFWMLILIPSSVITLIVSTLDIVAGNATLLIKDFFIIKSFLAIVFGTFIFVCMIDSYWLSIKNFIKEDRKGKLISIIILLIILAKEIFEILRSRH
ncbi:hypothetical protein psyc5s11_15660 [Clostridium gelidum]|uniref:Uncharacterized protein n=1 Tax=Clostridium gelidum TaxID=704125 RepID=A0ABM7T0T3_9CLOT|nr:hypothetical protein [Clostridium gelidum]BCZ45499.1 hypothetical protein psyc5s11_15660 [Clostridium gelidum]